jgi:hypothetical protein
MTKKCVVWVVETMVRGEWYAFDCRVSRSSAMALAREDRQRWPGEKFRVVKYASTKP